MSTFTTTLQDLVRRSGKSVNRFAVDAGMDPAYLRRLLSGEKTNPSVFTLIKLYGGVVSCSERLKQDPELVHAFTILLIAAVEHAAVDSVTGNRSQAR